MDAGEQATPTDVIAGTALTTTLKLPNFEPSCADAAVIVAVPAEAGLKTPAAVMLPIVRGVTDHVTALLKLPVPVTTDVQLDVWFVRIAAEEQDVETVAIVDSGVISFGPNKQPVSKMSGMESATLANA